MKTRVTEEKYDEMLGVLPPAYWNGNLFLVGEPFDHDEQGRARFDAYSNPSKGRYYNLGLMTISEAKNYKH
jgi:hypothetical protein